MGITEKVAHNPSHFLWDSDSAFQLLITDQHGLLRKLATELGITSWVVPEVAVEMTSNRKFGQRIASGLRKVRISGLLKSLDYRDLASFDPSVFSNPAVADAVSLSIQAKGRSYQLRVDVGEAYSHAAAVSLRAPLVSNDFNAIRTLVSNSLRTASPCLRFFDIVFFAYQRGWLSAPEANAICKALRAEGEHLPKAFAKTSFEAGLTDFRPRLIAGESGLDPPEAQYEFQRPLILR